MHDKNFRIVDAFFLTAGLAGSAVKISGGANPPRLAPRYKSWQKRTQPQAAATGHEHPATAAGLERPI
jgi:hypothetical protein